MDNQIATTLKAAYRICELGPLSGENLDKYYEPLEKVRNTQAVQNIGTALDFSEPGEFEKILFTGHQGCGKSTELRKLQRQLEQEYFVIYVEATNELDINDIEYTDIYLIVIQKVATELHKLGLKLRPDLLKSFEDWFKEIIQEDEKSVESTVNLQASGSVGGEIPFFMKLLLKFQSQLKGGSKHKTVIRNKLEKDFSRLQTDINLLLKDAFDKLKTKLPKREKGFLLIFDNLDRVSPTISNHLFFDYANQLKSLQITIIYTVPIAVVYSAKNLNNSFGNPNIMPMVNIYEKSDKVDLDYNDKGIEALIILLRKRIDLEQVFANLEDLKSLIRASGGHIRQLMRMTAIACLTAGSRGHNQVELEDITYAIKQEQFDFERRLLLEHYPILARVCRSKDINRDEVGQILLSNTAVLEYNGSSRWNYINPVVKKTIAFQEALEEVIKDDSKLIV